MKLWLRLLLGSIAMIVMVLASVAGLLYFSERRHLLNQQVHEQDESVKKLAQVCVESAAEKNDLILLNYILSLSKNGSVISASFVDPSGRVVIHSDVSSVGQVLRDNATARIISSSILLRQRSLLPDGKQVIDVSVPVTYRESAIGFARIAYDGDFYQKQVQSTLSAVMVRFSYVCAVAVLFGLLGSLLFAHALAKPIGLLVDATKIVGKGELTHRISFRRKDEIGTLALAFDSMTEKLQELDEMKNDFVSSVSHELRSPLTALKGYLQMFQMGITGSLNDKQKENVDVMMQCTDRLARFVNDILDVAKLESGMLDFNKEPVDAKSVASEIVTLFEPQAQSEKVRISLESDPVVSPVLADSDRLKQVFTNLLSNALKFTPEGGQIKVWLHNNGTYVKMGVSDTGAGIPKEFLYKIFNKFEQVKQTKTKAKKKGTGLGLTISKKIVEGCGGTIGVESELDKGTTFYFTLPKANGFANGSQG